MTQIARRLLLLAAICGLAAAQASAQDLSRFQPTNGRFSPYLLYNQFNGTGIPNYYSFVRPARQTRDYYTQTARSRAIRRPQPSVRQEVERAFSNEIRQRQTTGVGLPAIPATYGDRSHFFPTGTRRRR